MLDRLYACAAEWQTRRTNRSLRECVEKVREECEEALEVTTHAGLLDELGDVIVCALRAFHRMSPNEREFVCALMEMKVARRIDRGVKDKDSEAVECAELASVWKIKIEPSQNGT